MALMLTIYGKALMLVMRPRSFEQVFVPIGPVDCL